MKLTLDKLHENRIEFLAQDVTVSMANTLRRYSMSRVPILAIDKVTFYDNTSPLWDEYVAHRLGLLPITTPDKLPENSEIVFSLDAEGPKTVHASELKSSDKEIKVAKGTIPVLTLAANQRIRFECKAVVGTGRKHAKFQAGLVAYGNEGKGLRFFVESFFQMEPIEVIQRGCDAIESDLDAIEEVLSEKPKKKKKAEKEKVEKDEKE